MLLKSKIINLKRIAIMAAALVAVVSQSARAYSISPFNASELLERSDMVCKMTITSVTQKGLYPDTRFFRSTPKCVNMIATAKVISVINGPASDTIKISYPSERPSPKTQMVSFGAPLPLFKIGQTYLVALIGKSQPYQLTNISWCAMILPPGKVKYTYGTSPTDKLFAEFTHALSSKDSSIKKQAISQLAYLGDNRAAKLFRDMADSKDLSTRATGLIGGINVGETPAQQDLFAYLKMDPAKRVPTYITSHGFGGNTAGQIQDDIVSALYLSVIRPRAKWLKGFDYVSFVTKALRCKSVTDDGILRSDLANIISRLKSCGYISVDQCHRILKSIQRLGPAKSGMKF